MRGAIAEGLSASRFIKDMQAEGLSYRRTDMLADWRDVGEIKKKEGTARFIRKGYIPAANTVELKAWSMSREYMYKVRSSAVKYPGAKPEVRFINLMSDVPLTVQQIETEAWERAFDQSPPAETEEREFMIETAVRRV
jgi:hypothetical protein